MGTYQSGWSPIVELQTGQAVSDKFDGAFTNIDNGLDGLETMIGDIAGKNPLHGVVNPNTPLLSINIDTTKYEVAPLTYYIQGVEYTFVGGTFLSGFGQAGDFISIGLDSSGLVTKINNFFTPTELETILEIGRIASSDGTNITIIGDSVFFVDEYIKNLYIRFKSFGGTAFFNDAGRPTTNSINTLTFDISAGNINTPDMQNRSISAETQVAGSPIYNIAGDIGIRLLQSPLLANNTQYDTGVDLAPIPTGHYVQHTLFRSSGTGEYYLQYGQSTYTRLNEAISQDPINSLFNLQGSEVEMLAKVIVQEGVSEIVTMIDVRGQRNDVIGVLPVQADRVELEAFSLSVQEPLGLDIPLQIEFGAAQSNDNIDIALDGTVTFKKSGNYIVEFSTHFGRTSSVGSAILMGRVLVNGVQRGHTIYTQIDGSSDNHPFAMTSTIHFEVGDTYTFEMYRDSVGANDGGLYPQTSTLGWDTAPSSCLIIKSKD